MNFTPTSPMGLLDDTPKLREHSPIFLSPTQSWRLKQVIKYVEYYQPLYGIHVNPKPLRPCRDRAQAIEAALGWEFGDDHSLIDFGSSLGYFVFYFADRGFRCAGIDRMPQNCAVANCVAQINGLNCSFNCAELTLEYVRSLAPGRYDAGLLLSILHHIIHQRGLDYVRDLVAELLDRIPTLVLELAHRDEDVTHGWRDSQPPDPLDVLSRCRDFQIQKLGEFPTHLSDSLRPLWMVSKSTRP